MIGDDPQRGILQIADAGYNCNILDQALEQIDLIIAVHVLHHRSDALQPGAGIYRRLRQRGHGSIGFTIVLHKHQVPDFYIAIAIFIRTARWSTGHIFAVVIEYFRTGPTGSGVPHCPKIILLPQSGKSLRVYPHFI